jgi:hypothetical protein
MIDHSRKAGLRLRGQCRICGGECHRPDGFDANAIVLLIQPNQRLPLLVGTIFPRMNSDDFVCCVLSRFLQRLLNAIARVNMIPILQKRDGRVQSPNGERGPH